MALYKPQIKTDNGAVDLLLEVERAVKDGDGNTISSTYVKSVNNTTPDANGNVNVNNKTLLWENLTPSVDFAGTVISLNSSLSNFAYLVIHYLEDKQDSALQTIKIKLHSITSGRAIARLHYLYSNGQKGCTRYLTYNSNTKITVQDGYADGSLSNADLVPVYIYGTNEM